MLLGFMLASTVMGEASLKGNCLHELLSVVLKPWPLKAESRGAIISRGPEYSGVTGG